MNLFQLQERLKDFSQDQLVREMRNPSGSAPQYLVLSELQRRRRIMQEEQAQMPQQQATVAEEAVAAAGMPQAGLAQMAQALAPQTDMTQNTARMAEGGEVRRMDVGGRATGLAAINRNLADFMPMRRGARGNRFMNLTPDAMGAGIAVDALMADPRVQAAATTSNMSPEEYISALNSEQFQTALDMLNTPVENAPMRDEGRISDEEFMASRYDGPGGAYSVTERSGVPGRARLSEAGLTDVEPVPTVSAEDIRRMANENPSDYRGDGVSVIGAGIAGPYTEFLERMAETPLFPERRGMQFGETPVGSIQREATEEPMEETLQRILENSEAAIARDEGRVATPASTYDEVMPFDRNIYGSDDPYALPADRGMRTFDRTPDSTYDEVMAQRRNVYGSDDPYALPIDRAVRPVSGPGYQTRDVFIPADEFEIGLGTTDFGGNDPESLPAEIMLEQERERLAEQFQTEAEAADAETAALDRAILAAQFEAEGEVADAEARLPVVDLTEQREGAGGGGAGGAGGGAGAGAGASSDDLFEQDKWLALAQFGLSLMSSQAPTFGQALGEAGSTGIAALRQARADQQDRITAAQTRADRLAAAAARGSTRGMTPDQMADNFRLQASAYRDIAQGILDTSPTGELGDLPEDRQREYLEAISAADVLLRQSVNVSASGIAAAS